MQEDSKRIDFEINDLRSNDTPQDTEKVEDPQIMFGPTSSHNENNVHLLTKEELAKHGFNGPNQPLLLAVMGRVYNVDKGRDHYYGLSLHKWSEHKWSEHKWSSGTIYV